MAHVRERLIVTEYGLDIRFGFVLCENDGP